ncbi:extracellular solute-binding protein [Leifsonia sp. EB41]|uniref:extracellular solute-binding protein n=1 Tax=Leifsonia sp. EB41 TaxID=3156260 RepID=UPI003513D2E7
MIAIVSAGLLVLSGCSGSSGESSGPITLNFWGFSSLYKPQVEQYEKLHPNIKIQQKIGDYDAAHQTLLTALSAAKGPDIGQIAIDYMAEFTATPQAFTDLRTLGANDIKGDYLDWRWSGGVAKDGTVVGIPTDVGGMAVAYRTDLFQAAGLPTDPKAVSALWPTWNDYIATGKKYVAATGKKFIDSGKAIFRAASNQADLKYTDKDGKLVYATNPAIKQSWDYGVEAINAGLSANVPTYSPQWNAALADGGISTLIAPAWMLLSIKQQAPATAGKWNIATLPGAAGNDGGSFLVVPKHAAHPKEAYDFIKWLEAPEQQLSLFKDTADFPAVPSLYTNPVVTSYKDSFFSDAPAGQIYVDSVKAYHGHPVGPKDRAIENQFENGLGRVDQGQQSGDASWRQTLSDAKREAANG